MRVSALLLLAAMLSAAAPDDTDALVSAARSMPGEFSSAALTRIAATDKLDKPHRVELLELAFRRAADAQQRLKRHATPLRTDGSVGYWNRIYNQDLDALSLRLHAIETLLPLDPRKARELFATIPPLSIPRIKCDDFLVYDPSRFYDVLVTLSAKAFTSKEAAAGEPFQLLQRYAGSVTSPVQIAPLAHALAVAPVKDGELTKLVEAFTTALGKLEGDDRSFTYSVTAGPSIRELVQELQKRKISPLRLIESYRLYLIIHLSSARCADDDLMFGGGVSFGMFTGDNVLQQAANYVTFFNDKLRMDPLQPIQEQEATPTRLEGVATGLRVCQDSECQAAVKQERELIFSPEGAPYLPTQRAGAEWRDRLRLQLAALAAWKESSGGSPVEYFREKASVYMELLNLAPDEDTRDLILKPLVDFLKASPLQTSDRVEWFLPVNALIGRIGLDPLGSAKSAGILRDAGDPVITLYLKLEQLAPRPPDRVLSLL